MNPESLPEEVLDLERAARVNERLADVPALDSHPKPVEVTIPLVSQETMDREFPYGQ